MTCMHTGGFEWDWKHNQDLDLTRRANQQLIRGWLSSKLLDAVWLGVPCNTFSRARERGGGPPPLRSDEFPWGLPKLSVLDQRKVDTGNALARFASSVFQACLRQGIPCIIENPHTSRIWKLPCYKTLLDHPGARFVYTDFCAEGKPWRKRTGLLSCHVSLNEAIAHCKSRGNCDYSGQPHVVLEGKVDGVFRTSRAEPYPRSLCRRLARRLRDSMVASRVNNLESWM